MIARYRLYATRIRTELQSLEKVVARAEDAHAQTDNQPELQVYLTASAALDLHGFYSGLERLFELIARDIDGSLPSGSRWHRDLLAQMTLAVPALRPVVIQPSTYKILTEYLDFRHVVRNVYTYDLETKSVAELVADLRSSLDLARQDLLVFADFLDQLSTADEDN